MNLENLMFVEEDVIRSAVKAGQKITRFLEAAPNSPSRAIGALAEYGLGKSYVGTKTEQVWEGGLFDYRMLPTYHWGHSRIRLIFKLVDSESGKIVWMAEGTLQGPSGSAEALSKRLAEGLLEDLPSIPSGASSEAK